MIADRSQRKERITLSDNVMSAMMKLGEGNPGALSVLTSLFKEGKNIDKLNAFEGFGPILSLDALGIYGSDIWLLYKDICNESLVNLIGILRANQLGFLSEKELANAIENSRSHNLDIENLVSKVKDHLGHENFG